MIELFQTEQRTLEVQVFDEAGDPLDIGEFDVVARAQNDEMDVEYIEGSGVEVADSEAGRIIIHVDEAMTDVPDGRYTLEIRIFSESQVVTVLQSPLLIKNSLFREDNE